jgi:hypothetical protein
MKQILFRRQFTRVIAVSLGAVMLLPSWLAAQTLSDPVAGSLDPAFYKTYAVMLTGGGNGVWLLRPFEPVIDTEGYPGGPEVPPKEIPIQGPLPVPPPPTGPVPTPTTQDSLQNLVLPYEPQWSITQ